jgi:hypothetical protein
MYTAWCGQAVFAQVRDLIALDAIVWMSRAVLMGPRVIRRFRPVRASSLSTLWRLPCDGVSDNVSRLFGFREMRCPGA